jgi:GNAT superfamily N-acetyltransferase
VYKNEIEKVNPLFYKKFRIFGILFCMEYYVEKEPSFTIELPQEGDEIALAPMHVQAWKESYVSEASGMTDADVDEMMAGILKNTDYRKKTIIESLEKPDEVLYRIVKNAEGKIVGFLHGSKDSDFNRFDAIYLLDEAKGTGVGGKLAQEFLAWADKSKPSHLEVFSFNAHAIEFYERYGFVKTDKPEQLYKGRFPFIEMVRSADQSVQ